MSKPDKKMKKAVEAFDPRAQDDEALASDLYITLTAVANIMEELRKRGLIAEFAMDINPPVKIGRLTVRKDLPVPGYTK